MSGRLAHVRWQLAWSIAMVLVVASALAAKMKLGGRGRSARTPPQAANEAPTPPAMSLEQCVQVYTAKVRPLLAERCVRCHGPSRRAGGLRVDSLAALLEGGDGGPVLIPGAPDDSPLLMRVRAREMPRGGAALTHDEIALLHD